MLGFSLLLTRNGKGAQRGTTLTASARRPVSELSTHAQRLTRANVRRDDRSRRVPLANQGLILLFARVPATTSITAWATTEGVSR